MGKIRLAIHGAGGKMGQRLVALAACDPQLQVVAAIESEDHPNLGEDAGVFANCAPLGIPLSREFPEADVAIDFKLTKFDWFVNSCTYSFASDRELSFRLNATYATKSNKEYSNTSPTIIDTP